MSLCLDHLLVLPCEATAFSDWVSLTSTKVYGSIHHKYETLGAALIPLS